MKAAASRETPVVVDGLVAVVMPATKAPGVRAFGAMKPGVVYRVEPTEAVRLVEHKGFDYAGAPAAAATTDTAPAVVANPED